MLGILTECVDFEGLRRVPIKLFVTATNVRTGRGRVFRNAEITRRYFLRPPASLLFFKLSRSMANLTGTEAIRETRR